MAKNSLIWLSSDRGPCLRANNSLVVSIPDKCPSEKLLDPCVAEYSVTVPTRREAYRSICKLYSINMVKHRQGQTSVDRYVEGKTQEYSKSMPGSTIGEQCPKGLTIGVIQVHKQ